MDLIEAKGAIFNIMTVKYLWDEGPARKFSEGCASKWMENNVEFVRQTYVDWVCRVADEGEKK